MFKKKALIFTLLSAFTVGGVFNPIFTYADQSDSDMIYAEEDQFDNGARYIVADDQEKKLDFKWVEANSEEQVIEIDTRKVSGNIHVYAVTLRKNRLNDSKDVLLYAKCDVPILSSDFGGPDEFEGKLYLPQSDNYVKYNEGVVKNWLIWTEEDNKRKYDRQILKCLGNAEDSSITVRGERVTLVLNGEEFDIKISDEAVLLDTSVLDEAIVEHWNDYSAAKSAGLEIEENSEKAYLEKDKEAHALIEKARENGTDVSNDDIEAMRRELNEIFGELKPKPFDKTQLGEAVRMADEKITLHGKYGKRYTNKSYEEFIFAYSRAKEYMELEDLKSILTTGEGEPVITHRDMANAAKDLNEKTLALVLEEYKEVDISELENLYYMAVDRILDKGHGYTDETRSMFYKELDRARSLIFKKEYVEKEELEATYKGLEVALKGLEEENLNSDNKFTIKLKYIHQSEGAISKKIKEYFRDEQGNDIEDTIEIVSGTEYVIPIDEVRKFSGYRISSFHYGSDDGTLGLVKVIRDRENKQYAVFKAKTANLEVGTSLVVFYEEEETTPDNKDDETHPKTEAPDGDTAKPEDNKPKADVEKPKTDNNNPKVKEGEPQIGTDKPKSDKRSQSDNEKRNNNSSSGSSRSGGGSVRKASVSATNKNMDGEIGIITERSLVNEQKDVPGEWIKDTKGWWFKLDSKVFGGEYAKNQWVIIKNKWYIFDKNGYMLTSWQHVNNHWYFISNSGEMTSSKWVEYNSKWYYLKEDGSMAINETTPDGYKTNTFGEWVK